MSDTESAKTHQNERKKKIIITLYFQMYFKSFSHSNIQARRNFLFN